MDFAAGLERDGLVAVKFQLVFPAVAIIRQAVRSQSSIGSMKRPFAFAVPGESS